MTEQDKDQRVPRPLLALFGSRERVSEVSEEHQSQAEVGRSLPPPWITNRFIPACIMTV